MNIFSNRFNFVQIMRHLHHLTSHVLPHNIETTHCSNVTSPCLHVLTVCLKLMQARLGSCWRSPVTQLMQLSLASPPWPVSALSRHQVAVLLMHGKLLDPHLTRRRWTPVQTVQLSTSHSSINAERSLSPLCYITFWISLSLRPNFRLRPKTFLIRTQPVAERKFSLSISLSPNFGLSSSLI